MDRPTPGSERPGNTPRRSVRPGAREARAGPHAGSEAIHARQRVGIDLVGQVEREIDLELRERETQAARVMHLAAATLREQRRETDLALREQRTVGRQRTVILERMRRVVPRAEAHAERMRDL